jgi:hypothetical protein
MKELQVELEALQSSVIEQNISLVLCKYLHFCCAKGIPVFNLFFVPGLSLSQVVIDSIAALARKEGYNERDKETFFIHQVR